MIHYNYCYLQTKHEKVMYIKNIICVIIINTIVFQKPFIDVNPEKLNVK